MASRMMGSDVLSASRRVITDGFIGPVETAEEPAATVLVTRTLRPGTERQYRNWCEGIRSAARQFPGFLGMQSLPVLAGDALGAQSLGGQAQGRQVRSVLYGFRSPEDLARWMQSPERAVWLDRLDELVEPSTDPAEIQVPGLELGLHPRLARHREAIAFFAVAFPIGRLVAWGVQHTGIAHLPGIASAMVSTMFGVVMMTYFGAPLVGRVLGRWMRRHPLR